MGYRKISPSLKLMPFVDHFWVLDIQEKDLPFTHTILPYAWFELFFNLDDSSDGEGKFMGQLSKSLKIKYQKPFKAVGISLRPSVGNALFSVAAHQLKDQNLYWSDLDIKSTLHEQLVEVESIESVIYLLEMYICDKIKNYEVDLLSVHLSERISKAPYHRLDSSLFSDIGLSRRRVEQRFIETVGVTMGTYLRKCRFDAVVDSLALGNKNALTQVGLEQGYYDQAHFTREFKQFAGFSPKEYREKVKGMSKLERVLQYSNKWLSENLN